MMDKERIPVFYSDADIGEAIEKLRQNLDESFVFHLVSADKDLPPIGMEGAVFIIDAVFYQSLPIRAGKGKIYFIIVSRSGVPLPRGLMSGGAMVDVLPQNTKADRLLFALTRAGDILRLKTENEELKDTVEVGELELEELTAVAVALSAEHDLDALLELVLTNARMLTSADAGSLYLLEEADSENPKLRFMLAQNDSREVKLKSYVMDATHSSIAGHVALDGEVLNIEDVYNLPADSPFKFGRNFDAETGYRTRSMLVVPMKTHMGDIIGVLQLINRKMDFEKALKDPADFEGMVLPFDVRSENLARAFGSQAAVSLENSRLYKEIETLFEGFVRASVSAIEARDPATSGHSERVAALTVELAKAVNNKTDGPFKDEHFSKEQLKEIEYAALLHDFGKIGVRESVLVKEKKLYPWELDSVKNRLECLKKDVALRFANLKIEALTSGESVGEEDLAKIDGELAAELKRIDGFIKAVEEANEPRLLKQDTAGLIKEIGAMKQSVEGGEKPVLTDSELARLSIPKGSLDEAERKEIESHVNHSYSFLVKIPWTRNLKNVPEIAYQHHEKLNGGGYPRGIKIPDIAIQGRMMCIADVFDALTASDRPYKPAVPVEKALEILADMAEHGQFDKELLALFVESGVYEIVL
jgi:HD-GYP domain-containing protein (c-di-GMP phosphodiesterase class II)